MLRALLLLAMLTAHTSAPAATRTYSPRTAAQATALRSSARECAYMGRRFGGKSNIGCLKAYAYCSRYAGARALVAREERASMESTTLLTLREEIIAPELWAWGWHESKSILRLPNRSEIHVLGLDRPERILGTRYGFAFVDQAEQLDWNQFQIVLSSCMQAGVPWHQLLLAFNPEGPGHWAYHRYRPDLGNGAREDARGKKFADVVLVNPDDLLDVLPSSAIEVFDSLEGVYRERLRLGRWVALEGSVYDGWDPAVHVIDPPAEFAAWGGYPPPDWQRWRGVDFGYEPDPYTCQWWADAPDGRRLLYRQDYRVRQDIDQQAARINAAEALEIETLRAAAETAGRTDLDDYLERLNVVATYSDHDRQERVLYGARGISTARAAKDIRAGIETVRSLMSTRAGRPALQVVRGSLMERDPVLAEKRRPTCLEEEVVRYRWRTSKENREAGRTRDLPVDQDNHGLDAMRYVHHSRAVYGVVGFV